MKTNRRSTQAFTLIELLVVILIIGILVAIAIPQYQKSVYKSRFSALMPITKAIADGNEAYYMAHSTYTDDPTQLDIAGKKTYADGTDLTLGESDDYAYVLAKNTKFPDNHYIVYQKHSVNYPGEVHCEAKDNDDRAAWLCQSLGATQSIGKTITEGYTTYILKGTGSGIMPGADEDEEDENDGTVVSCNKALAAGFTCDISTNDQGKQVKKICRDGFCRIKTYDEEGGYTSVTCQANSENVCAFYGKSVTYDANGNKTSERQCSFSTDGSCIAGSYNAYDWTYDTDGKLTSKRKCADVNNDGSCRTYEISKTEEYAYDANGNMIISRTCSKGGGNICTAYGGGTFYIYDADGNKIFQTGCSQVSSDGTSCNRYSSNTAYGYTYDANGNMTSQRVCTGFTEDGVCTAYSSSSSANYDWTYDSNGNMITERNCKTVAADGSCTYNTNGSSVDYTYDANGNRTSMRRLATGYSGYVYTYDTNGNMISQRVCTVAADGSCAAYSGNADENYNYTYDANGNMTSRSTCNRLTADGSCDGYKLGTYYYVFDEDGNQIAQQACSGDNLNTADGSCIAYNSGNTTTYAY